VLGKTVKEMDLTEKMAFFEAYGSIAGAAGLKPMSALLLPRGLLRMKEASETRACAAIALGKIRSPEAREILQRAADDKDLVVRNAVSRALRESGA
jgi:HEAT repeat protein